MDRACHGWSGCNSIYASFVQYLAHNRLGFYAEISIIFVYNRFAYQ